MLSLVIPYYNDSGCPVSFINELRKEFQDKKIKYELILVDDCSTDNTPKELDSLKNKNTRIIHNQVNKDYGGAIMAGLNIAKGDVLGFSCGDGEVSAKDIVKVYNKMKKSDIIKAIRKNRQDGLDRKIISKVFNIWTRLRFNLDIEDINGYPVYFKKEVYRGLKNIPTNWIFNTDLLRKIKKNGYEIKGIVIQHEKRSGGKSKMTPHRIIKMIIKYIRYK